MREVYMIQIFEFVFPPALILLLIYALVRMRKERFRSGTSMTTILHGTFDALYNAEKKKAAEMVVDQNAKKRLEVQGSGIPSDKNEAKYKQQ